MKITDTTIPEVKIIEPKVFYDDRGFFSKASTKKYLKKLLPKVRILFKIITLNPLKMY